MLEIKNIGGTGKFKDREMIELQIMKIVYNYCEYNGIGVDIDQYRLSRSKKL